jgi:cardiolipin synthase
MFLEDLGSATEIVLRPRPHRRARTARPRLAALGVSRSGGSASRAAAGALRLGRVVGAALSEQRVLEPTEARLVAAAGIVALGIGVATVLWPLVAAIPVAALLTWIAIALLAKARALSRIRRSKGLPRTRLAPRTDQAPPSPDR